jgi:3',5'-cyclic-AMP phosphodiesterase
LSAVLRIAFRTERLLVLADVLSHFAREEIGLHGAILMLIAQITDLHVTRRGWLCSGKVDTGHHLRAAIKRICTLAPAPDLVIVTGDLVDRGEREEYRELRRLIEPLPMPVFVIPGNHDDRDELQRAFADQRYLRRAEGFLHYAIEDWPLRLIALDTVVQGEMGGELCADRLSWLERVLSAEPTKPALIFMHHPPFVTGLTGMDAIGLKGAAAMADIVGRHPEIQLITAGHMHRAIQRRVGGTIAATCPSTAHQITFDLDCAAPVSFTLEPPAFQLHLWDGDGLVTHTVLVERCDGPHPFTSYLNGTDDTRPN